MVLVRLTFLSFYYLVWTYALISTTALSLGLSGVFNGVFDFEGVLAFTGAYFCMAFNLKLYIIYL